MEFAMKINYWSVLVAAISAFVFSSLYYSLLANVWRAVDPAAAAGAKPSMVKALVEIVRTIIISFVLATLIKRLGSTDVKSAVQLALWLWFGFSAMMWVGAIMWERTPWQVAAIHSGDWLVKTVLIAVIISIWRASCPSDWISSSFEADAANHISEKHRHAQPARRKLLSDRKRGDAIC
jgi:hypothetical protein